MKLSDNTVLITGGSRGIGRAMADAFLDAKSNVIICGRDEERLIEAQRRRPDLHVVLCDLADEKARKELAGIMADRFPRLNVLVNNAGLQRDVDFTKGVNEFLSGDNEIRVNLEAPIILSGLLIPVLASNPQPALINVSSGLGFVPMATKPVYSASKAGLHAFSMAMRVQLRKLGMKVFEIVPPPVDTHLNPEGRAKHGGFKSAPTPEEFVAAVMRALESDTPEIGYGMTASFATASRQELDRIFAQMNDIVRSE